MKKLLKMVPWFFLTLFVTEIVCAVPSFAVYANRTGAILRRLLPEIQC